MHKMQLKIYMLFVNSFSTIPTRKAKIIKRFAELIILLETNKEIIIHTGLFKNKTSI